MAKITGVVGGRVCVADLTAVVCVQGETVTVTGSVWLDELEPTRVLGAPGEGIVVARIQREDPDKVYVLDDLDDNEELVVLEALRVEAMRHVAQWKAAS